MLISYVISYCFAILWLAMLTAFFILHNIPNFNHEQQPRFQYYPSLSEDRPSIYTDVFYEELNSSAFLLSALLLSLLLITPYSYISDD